MPNIIFVQVPGELAARLPPERYRRFMPPRDAGSEALFVLTVINMTVGVGADVATIVLARDSIGDFVATVRSWIKGLARSGAGHERVADKRSVELTYRGPGVQAHILVECERSPAGAVTEPDLTSLFSLLSSELAKGGPQPEAKRKEN